MDDNPNEAARLAVWRLTGELLRAIRLKRGYSRQQLAARAGVSVDLIAAYASGRERFPTHRTRAATWRSSSSAW
jgi:DNA-binding transcriptional regulator YiaG